MNDEPLLVLAALTLLLGLLVSPRPKVQQAADRRRPVGIDLYQIEVAFLSDGQGLGDGQYAEVLARVRDYPNLSCPDPLVYTKVAKYTSVPAKELSMPLTVG
jgi:hypothetical protein